MVSKRLAVFLLLLFLVFSNGFSSVATLDSINALIKSQYCIGYILSNHVYGISSRDQSEGSEIYRDHDAEDNYVGLVYSIINVKRASGPRAASVYGYSQPDNDLLAMAQWCGKEQLWTETSDSIFPVKKKLDPAKLSIKSGYNKIGLTLCLCKMSPDKNGNLSMNECDHVELHTTLLFLCKTPNNISFNMSKISTLALEDYDNTRNINDTLYPDKFDSYATKYTDTEMKLGNAYFAVVSYDSGSVHGLPIEFANYYLDGIQLFYIDCNNKQIKFDQNPFYRTCAAPEIRDYPFYQCVPGFHTMELRLVSGETSFSYQKKFNAVGNQEIVITKEFLISDTVPNSKLQLTLFDSVEARVNALIQNENRKVASQQQNDQIAAKQREIPDLVSSICGAVHSIAMHEKIIERENRIGAESGVYNKVKLYNATQGKLNWEDSLKRYLNEYYSKTGQQYDLNNCR